MHAEAKTDGLGDDGLIRPLDDINQLCIAYKARLTQQYVRHNS